MGGCSRPMERARGGSAGGKRAELLVAGARAPFYTAALLIQVPPRGPSTGSRPSEPLAKQLHCHRSEEHTSELQSLMRISYAVFCLKKKKNKNQINKANMTTERN